MKKLASILQNVETKQEKQVDNREQQLAEAVAKIAEINPTYKELEKVMKVSKDTVKSLCTELGYDTYENCGVKITLSHADKSYLAEAPTIEYLKKNGFEKFIKTKEYFDEAEIAMAIAHDEIKAEDLAEFMVKKDEVRLLIK